MTFVIGAGIGSITHMFFMLTLLLVRRIKCGRLSKEEREARRATRSEGRIRLEGEDTAVCVLRAPEGDLAQSENMEGSDEREERLPGYDADRAQVAKKDNKA